MRAAWLDSPWVTALVGLAVAILAWDPAPVTPAVGSDPSWIVGLNLGAEMGLDHGTEIVFTYGPLGFLQVPLVIDGVLATTGAIYLLALRALLAASLLYAARRSFEWLPAAFLALVATMITPSVIAPLVLAAVWSMLVLQESPSPGLRRSLLIAGGVLAGLEVLVKLNVGISVLVVVAITAAFLPGPRLRALGTMLAAFTITAVALWFAAGQGLGNADDYVRSSLQVVSGYSETMPVENPGVSWDWWAALATAGLVFAGTWAVAAKTDAHRRLPLALIVAFVAFSLFKFGFVRHDDSHVGQFFGGMGALMLGLRWSGGWRPLPAVGLGLLTLVCFTAANHLDGGPLRPRQAVDQLTTLLIPAQRADARAEARAGLQQAYILDSATRARIGDAPTAVLPWEIGIAWAYGLNWDPLPVIQDYQAYTPQLDRLNGEALASPDGPILLLRHFGRDNSTALGFDGRYVPFDAPAQTLAMLCAFRPVSTTTYYQLLKRGPNRCGEPRTIAMATASYGETIEVPEAKPNEAVFASVEGAAPSGVERVRSFAFRAAVRHIETRFGRTRFAPSTAADGLLMTAPAGADFPAPFNLAPQTRSFSIDSEGGPLSSESELQVRFEAVPIQSRP